MGETITIRTSASTDVIKVIEQGPQGIQGPAGTGLTTLTQTGDMLYRDGTGGQRLPIGSSGQILKVGASGIPEWGAAPASGVSSVNGESGAVSLSAADVGAAATLHAGEHEDGEADQIMASAVIVDTEDVSLNGVYVPDGTLVGGRLVYYRPGTRKNTKLQYNTTANVWYLIKNTVQILEGQESNAINPWTPQQWIDIRSPQGLPNGGTITQASLEKLARSTTENVGTAALSDATDFAAASHTHTGSQVNVGSTSGLPLKTGAAGVVEAGSFGTSAGTFAAGDDARFTDSRNPLAHKVSHAIGGTDVLAPSDLGAQSLFVSENIVLSANVTLGSSRAKKWRVQNYNGTTYNITLPTTGVQEGDVVVITTGTLVGSQTIREDVGLGSFVTLATISEGQSYRFISDGTSSSSWAIDQVYTHTHVVADVTGAAASGSITTSGLTQATARILGRTTASTGSVEELTVSGGASLSAGALTVHAQSHAITSASDHTAGSNKIFYSDNTGAITELALGANGTVLTSNGATSAPSFAAASGGGATNLWIPASAWIPRTTSGCGVDSVEIGSTNRQNLDQLLFDTGSEEFAQALVVMPSNYNNSTLTVRFYWTASSGSGGVAWGISGRAFGDDDAIDQATGTRIVVTDTLLAANDVHVTAATSAVTIDGTPAANKAINFQISRVVADAADTLAVDARFLGVEIIFN